MQNYELVKMSTAETTCHFHLKDDCLY